MKKCIEIERLRRLQTSIGFLDSYKTPVDEVHHIGANINTENVKKTKLLRELGRINLRREVIIKSLMGTESN